MRKGLFGLFILVSLLTNGQSQLTADVATEFVNTKINDLNIKLWNAVKSGKIIAYRNDSLVTAFSRKELIYETQIESVVTVQNPLNPEDPYDLIDKREIIKFDSSTQFEGMDLHFDKKVTTSTVSFELVSIAPVWRPLTESSITLGITPLFHIKLRDLRRLLSAKEYSFYESLFMTRTSLGDLNNPFYYPYKDTKQLGESIAHYNTFYDHHYIYFHKYQDTIMGYHYAKLLPFVASKAWYSNIAMYKDSTLENAYHDITFELADSFAVMVPDLDPNDPYELITTSVFSAFDFYRIKNIRIVKQKNEVLINFIIECTDSNGDNRPLSTCKNNIYLSYSSIKHLLQPQDRIVLEILMDEIVK